MMENLSKQAVVIGGSNGMGLALSMELMDRGYALTILDIMEPDGRMKTYEGRYAYRYCDLMYFDAGLLGRLSADEEIDALVVTAGLGRVCGFESLHYSEIKKVLRVNAEGVLEAVRFFYGRIKSERRFYTCVMGSIAGWISSPLFSVYAASKAAVCRFCESVNAELEASGNENRILNVSPGSLKGTRFYGGENDPGDLGGLAKEIADRMFGARELYIPGYEETWKGILERYRADPKGFGLQSYRYKLESGRLKNERKAVVGYLSGTFDLFHVGHLNLLRRAKRQCDHLIVGVHESGAWKGKETFIPLKDRMEIVASCRYVDEVVVSEREDSEAWDKYCYDKLFVGGDYVGSERFKRYEAQLQGKAEIVYFPYTDGISSSMLRREMAEKAAGMDGREEIGGGRRPFKKKD